MSNLHERLTPHLVSDNLSEATAHLFLNNAIERYSEPWRHYHTVRHLGQVAGFLLDNIDKLHNPRITLWAAIGHDEVYVPQAPSGVNEELSAQLTEDRLTGHLPDAEVALAASYIRATTDHVRTITGKDRDLAYFLDADLAILGAPEDEFDEYEANIRKEYSFAPDDIYNEGRFKAMGSFMISARGTYRTQEGYDRFNLQSFYNLKRSIEKHVPKNDPEA